MAKKKKTKTFQQLLSENKSAIQVDNEMKTAKLNMTESQQRKYISFKYNIPKEIQDEIDLTYHEAELINWNEVFFQNLIKLEHNSAFDAKTPYSTESP